MNRDDVFMAKKIYIPFDFEEENMLPYWRQFPDPKHMVWKDCIFTFEDCDDYDYLVVIDNIARPVKTHLPKSNRVLLIGEPPYVDKYDKAYIRQFGLVHTCIRCDFPGQRVINSFPALPWMVGYKQKEGRGLQGLQGKYLTYADFKNLPHNADRKDRLCIITSNKTMTKGHRQRVAFVERLLSEGVGFVDVYGNGYQHVDDKFDVLYNYKYALVIENCAHTDYWTEKLADCILAGCYPIYHGAPNVSQYFGEGVTTVDINNYDETLRVLHHIISQKTYESSTASMAANRDRVLDEYNCFNVIADVVDGIPAASALLGQKELINPIHPRLTLRIKDKIQRMMRR